MHDIKVPSGVQKILNALHQAGHEAYVVGGCVRDSLLGLEPHDWDICTSAIPTEVANILSEYEVIPTGLKHGTVTAISAGMLSLDSGYQITTFRCDGDYYDNRHPSSVAFVSDLTQDLARRDFTINSIAYNEDAGIVDLHNGIYDLQNGIIACVGNPDERFCEDALRILRALRFSSVYGFSIDEATAQSIHKNRELLKNISAERIQAELVKTLAGKGVLQILLDYSDVISTIIPELEPCIGFEQNNRYHQYTVYEHIAHAVDNYKGTDTSVKVALLLHDIGKPHCYTEDENGGHFHGHGTISHNIAKVVLERLRFDNKTKNEVLELVLYHDSVIEPTPKTARRWLNKIGEHRFQQLIDVRMADMMAHAVGTQALRIERCKELNLILHDVLEKAQCFSLKDLQINGNDIMCLGVEQGKRVGSVLNAILGDVISGSLENRHDILMQKAVEYLG